ncbi:hypothetical protein HHTV1_2 [Haloarcula hispanica tailed virus 1]|uniref:Uncharacterized protein n=1 Tax=Haloarcula hispanica tailed virus 1 TaxID=1273750 RepID=R4TM66_9CAUD|nr:hypothetical protein M198_gp02 [Haloarcula hispanica tailed virus 1]AGM11258.1 hypothetical protein HHTV1_2 [Haloarcula hispanica tailed virus 1]
MQVDRRSILKAVQNPRGSNSEMTQYTEADVDAKGTDCPCCGDQMERKESRLCSGCETEGCDPSTKLCLKDLGGA